MIHVVGFLKLLMKMKHVSCLFWTTIS